MEDELTDLEASGRVWENVLHRIAKAVDKGTGVRLTWEECVTIRLGFDDPVFDSDVEQN